MTDISTITKIHGLQFMPVREDKRPIHEGWQITKKDYDFTGAKAIGLVCGRISGNVEAIDIDTKYDLTGKLFSEYCSVIKSIDPDLLNLLLIQKTVSGGYHFIYRCSYIEGNKKLANRLTTPEEKKATYDKEYKREYEKLIAASKELAEAETMAQVVATNAANNDKIRVLIETRGDKGYIACAPTKGYTVKRGSFDKINAITPDQRTILFNVAFTFNEVLKEPINRDKATTKQTKGLSPSEDYNDRGDVVELLEKHGWENVGKRGSKWLMKRPGDTKASQSGNYDEARREFSVFSTSTMFEAQTPYKPYAVFAFLELEGDFKKVPRALYDLGYGERQENIKDNDLTVPSVIDTSVDDLFFLAVESDYENYLSMWRKGDFPMGKTTGIPELDKYFRFKEGNLVIVNGIDNVGKSTVIWYLAMLSSLYNDWKWLIFSSENGVGTIVRKLIEFYCCESIVNLSDGKYNDAKKYVLSKFDFIKTGEKLYNYQDIINMTKLAMKKKKYHALMIDPYNSLKIDIPVKSKQGTYDYHYEAASTLQLFGKLNSLSIYLNCHVGTTGARNKDAQGFTIAPQKEDTEMGVMFANKADDFITIHRITQHAQEWMMTEIHVRKIKESETGGKITAKDKPFKMKMVSGVTGFQHFDFNPVKEWHRKTNPHSPQINFYEPVSNSDLDSYPPDNLNVLTPEQDDNEPPF